MPGIDVEEVLPLTIGGQGKQRQAVFRAHILDKKIEILLRKGVHQRRRMVGLKDPPQGFLRRQLQNRFAGLIQPADLFPDGRF